MKNSILLMIIFSMEIAASSTMMMPQAPNRDDAKIVIGGSVSTETGYKIPKLKLFREFSSERQKNCLHSSAVKLATARTNSLMATTTEIESQLKQLKVLVDSYDNTPQFCLEITSPSLIATIKKQSAKDFRAGNRETFEVWYKRFEIESLEIFSALDALTIKFAKPYALNKLKAEISKHPDVEYVENNIVFGGGPDSIQMQKPGLYVFEQGWGDCMAGCIHGRRITVQVYDNKAVEIENKHW